MSLVYYGKSVRADTHLRENDRTCSDEIKKNASETSPLRVGAGTGTHWCELSQHDRRQSPKQNSKGPPSFTAFRRPRLFAAAAKV